VATKRIQKYSTKGTLGAVCAVVVIESLRDGELKTGQRLRDDLETIAISMENLFAVRYVSVESANELASLLNELRSWVVESGGIGLCLHIECHGDKDGIQLADDSVMSWDRLRPLLAGIHLASRMNLIFWLASCHGGYAVLACRYSETVPFTVMVGPGREIDPSTLLAFTSTFYTELFRTGNVTEALTIAGVVRPDLSYINYSAVGALRTALAARIKGTPRELRQQMEAVEEAQFDKWRRIYFALDVYPQNSERFAVTYTEVLAEVEASAE
jgi:hypothetical protein